MTLAQEQGFVGSERFQIQRRLGAGGFGVVYQALDRDREKIVALKALRDGNVEALFRLKREFRALADIAHTNLVCLHELLVHGDQWFFTMELIEGVNFLQYVRGTPFPDPVDSVAQTAALAGRAPSPVASPKLPSAAARDLMALALEAASDPESAAPPPLDSGAVAERRCARRSRGSRPFTAPASFIGTSSRPTSSSPARGASSCSTSEW